MSSKRLFELMGTIDEDLIEESEVYSSKTGANRAQIIALLSSAAAAVLIIGGILIYMNSSVPKRQKALTTESETAIPVINSANIDTAVGVATVSDPMILKADKVTSSGCMLTLSINDKDSINEYYTFENESYELFILKDNGYTPCEDNNMKSFMSDEPAETKMIELDSSSVTININWFDKYGDLEPGKYKVNVYIYPKDQNKDPVPLEVSFEISE